MVCWLEAGWWHIFEERSGWSCLQLQLHDMCSCEQLSIDDGSLLVTLSSLVAKKLLQCLHGLMMVAHNLKPAEDVQGRQAGPWRSSNIKQSRIEQVTQGVKVCLTPLCRASRLAS